MFFLLAVLTAGVLSGWFLRKISVLALTNRHLTRVSLWALLTVMGAKIGLHRGLFSKDLNVFFAAIGSSVFLTAVFFLVFWMAAIRKKNSAKKSAPQGSQKALSATSGQTGSSLKELLSVAVNAGCVFVGFLLFWLLPESYTGALSIDTFTDWLLRALLYFIGFDLGVELHRLDMRRLTPQLLLVPFLNIALTLTVGLLFGLLSGLGARQGSLLTAGMGWYSLSSVLLADRGMMLLSILSFIHNVFRELLAILCAPLAARISPLLPVYLGGATSMDVTLPFVQRYSGKEYTLVSFYSGVICSIAVMPLVKIIL